ncbi:hypothetical protein GOP47_0005856 [Adiantum capillus-veneris]|uniref:Protein RETICULATA-RELATED 3, chloroplastic n=1 Tax=Adiantum capillus-veneris TaxID=13818 RepID=A0A9D4ZNN3_ADICA|nr:hypothetical protein GOP47_0005856 [Adiantum capillus-veneris]
MAAQIRSVLPSSTPFPSSPPPGSSFSRFSGIAHRNEAFPPFSARFASGSDGRLSWSPLEDRFGPELLDNGDNGSGSGGNGGGGDNHDGHNQGGRSDGGSLGPGGIFGAFLKGWNGRVLADPQFPFKVLMEEVVGVGACVIGDMASRPNFGLNELDFVFSTIVVGSILNFSLMYMLAPTSITASAASSLPSFFASCPPGHMFEQGAYSVLDRLGTFVYKGAVFGTVGFAAGVLGTVISNVLIGMRKKMDPTSEMQVKAPPTVLNAATWALHMGLSSNLRYQVVNGLEFAMANTLSPPLFKASVLCTRAVNNVLGGMSFVALARLTGSQKVDEAEAPRRAEMSTLPINEAVAAHLDKASTGLEPLKEESLNLLKEENAAH